MSDKLQIIPDHLGAKIIIERKIISQNHDSLALSVFEQTIGTTNVIIMRKTAQYHAKETPSEMRDPPRRTVVHGRINRDSARGIIGLTPIENRVPDGRTGILGIATTNKPFTIAARRFGFRTNTEKTD